MAPYKHLEFEGVSRLLGLEEKYVLSSWSSRLRGISKSRTERLSTSVLISSGRLARLLEPM